MKNQTPRKVIMIDDCQCNECSMRRALERATAENARLCKIEAAAKAIFDHEDAHKTEGWDELYDKLKELVRGDK